MRQIEFSEVLFAYEKEILLNNKPSTLKSLSSSSDCNSNFITISIIYNNDNKKKKIPTSEIGLVLVWNGKTSVLK